MSDTNSIAGWNATDGDEVPVRHTSEKPTVAASRSAVGPAADIQATPASPVTQAVQAAATSTKTSMLSAFTGIAAVSVGVLFAFGIGLTNLRGDIASTPTPTAVPSQGNPSTVTITATGTFDPAAVSVPPGGTLTFVNANKDPQVLKSVDSKTLFPSQVVFTDPVTVTIPSDASGEYAYFSETLPDSVRLVIRVGASAQTVTTSSGAGGSSPETPIPFGQEKTVPSAGDIPIPFGTPTNPTIPVSTASPTPTISVTTPDSGSSQPTGDVAPREYQNNPNVTAVISIAGSRPNPVEQVHLPSTTIATNPYTVAEAGKHPAASSAAVASAQKKTLHSGAPLMASYRPKSVSQTGPEGTMALLALSLIGVCILSRRMANGIVG